MPPADPRPAGARAAAARGTIIFDLDGTLVDSAPDLADSLDLLMAEQGLRPFGLTGTRALIGHGIPALVRGALEKRGETPDDARLVALTAQFIRIYTGRLSRKTAPYPGARAALSTLCDAGWRLVVCTNKREAAARAILSDLGLINAFALVAGPDTFGVAKPDPTHLLKTLPDERPEGYAAIMIGDSEVDVAAARAARVPVIACAWGYAPAPAASLGADAVADGFDEALALIDRLAAAHDAPGAAP